MPEMKTKLIAGQAFEITAPYAEGHVCTAAEAKALNQTRAENIGNNLRDSVKEALAKAETDANALTELAALVQKYDAEYTFALGGGGVSKRTLDPVEREARSIANDIIKADLAKKGRKVSQVPEGLSKDEWEAKLDDVRETLMARDDVLAAAKKRVKEKQKIADSGVEGLGL